LQTLIAAVAAIPLYKLALYETENPKQALIFALLYLAYPPMTAIFFFDFHIQVFLPLLFFSAFYYFKREKWSLYFVSILLSLMVIEFVGLIVMFFGLYGMWVNRKKVLQMLRSLNFMNLFSERGILSSIITMFLGIGFFIFAKKLTLMINPTAPPHPNWQTFGDPVHNLPEFVFSLLTNPIKVMNVLFSSAEQKLLYLFGLLSPVVFLPLLDLPSFLIATPWILAAFLSNYPPYYTPLGYQYTLFVCPFVFISAIKGVKKIQIIKQRYHYQIDKLFRKCGSFRGCRFAGFLLFALILSIAYINILGIKIEFATPSEHERLAEEFTRLIPSNASVLTQNDLLPHLSKRLYVYTITEAYNLPRSLHFDYILVDVRLPWYTDVLAELVYNLTNSGAFRIRYAADGIWLLERNYSGNITFPIEENGILVNFYNQGAKMKIFNGNHSNALIYEKNVFSIIGAVNSSIPEKIARNYFTLTLEGKLYIPTKGKYLFQLESIGGASNFYLDNKELIHVPFSCTRGNCSVTLGRGFHLLRVEYERRSDELSSAPFILLTWKPPWKDNFTFIEPSFLYLRDSPDVSAPFLDMNWNLGTKNLSPLTHKDAFSIFIEGKIYIPQNGNYTFRIKHNGYITLLIDEQIVLSSFKGSTQSEVKVSLKQGIHTIYIDYMKLPGDFLLSVDWIPPGRSNSENIPLNYLFWNK